MNARQLSAARKRLAIVEQRNLEGWSRETVETCAHAGLDVGMVARVVWVRP